MQEGLVRADARFEDFGIAGGQLAAVDLDPEPAVRSLELDAALAEVGIVLAAVVAGGDHGHAVGEPVLDAVSNGHVVDALLELPDAVDLDRAGPIGPVAPHRQVVHVRAAVGQLAVGVVQDPSEVEVAAAGIVGRPGRRAQPRVVVEPRWGLLRRVTVGGGWRLGRVVLRQPALAGQIRADGVNLPDPPVEHQLAADASPPRPLLASRLEDAAIPLGGLADGPALADGQGVRLLAVDVLAGLQCGDGDQGVPVVGCGDQDGVNVVPCDKVAEVLVRGTALVLAGRPSLAVHLLDTAHRGVSPGRVHVADGQSLDVAPPADAEVPASLAALADEAHRDPLTGGGPPGAAQGLGGDDVRGGEPRGGGLQQRTTRHESRSRHRLSPNPRGLGCPECFARHAGSDRQLYPEM